MPEEPPSVRHGESAGRQRRTYVAVSSQLEAQPVQLEDHEERVANAPPSKGVEFARGRPADV